MGTRNTFRYFVRSFSTSRGEVYTSIFSVSSLYAWHVPPPRPARGKTSKGQNKTKQKKTCRRFCPATCKANRRQQTVADATLPDRTAANGGLGCVCVCTLVRWSGGKTACKLCDRSPANGRTGSPVSSQHVISISGADEIATTTSQARQTKHTHTHKKNRYTLPPLRNNQTLKERGRERVRRKSGRQNG